MAITDLVSQIRRKNKLFKNSLNFDNAATKIPKTFFSVYYKIVAQYLYLLLIIALTRFCHNSSPYSES